MIPPNPRRKSRPSKRSRIRASRLRLATPRTARTPGSHIHSRSAHRTRKGPYRRPARRPAAGGVGRQPIRPETKIPAEIHLRPRRWRLPNRHRTKAVPARNDLPGLPGSAIADDRAVKIACPLSAHIGDLGSTPLLRRNRGPSRKERPSSEVYPRRSNRSASITFVQAFTKSFTNFAPASSAA